MQNSERKRFAKLNIYISILGQIITIICGLIIPRLLIKFFGSEAYGATASIAQFISYVALLEGGIGGVARAALYKPLAENNSYKVSQIVYELQRFFSIVSYIFIAYIIVLAVVFKYISKIECFDWLTTVILVLSISVSTFAQYFIGISYAVLIQAGQRTFATQIITIITTILNTVLIVILTQVGCNLIVVKLVSSFVFAIRPIAMKLYATKVFGLQRIRTRDKSLLSQKWTGLGQHIAFFLHSNTDIAVLTLFSDLKYVAVYSVYSLVVTHIQSFSASFLQGLEALFGDMLAKKEIKLLNETFQYYETLISSISLFFFSITSVMIIPFVKIYTVGISDANYIQPIFAFLLIISALLYCLMQPYHFVVIAAGHFKQTKWSAYGEAIINLSLSIALVFKFNMIGIAIGTVIATLFRFVYYVVYLSKHIIERPVLLFVKRFIVNTIAYIILVVLGVSITKIVVVENWFFWCGISLILAIINLVAIYILDALLYRNDLVSIKKLLFRSLKK